MKLDGEDRKYLDTKFDGIHIRITELGERVTRVEEAPCEDVKEHEEKRHNLVKILGLFFGALAAMAGVAAAVAAFVN